MNSNVSDELLLEHMKAVRAELCSMRDDIRSLRSEVRAVKGHVAVLVQSDLDRDGRQEEIFSRLDRIERRLDLAESPAE